MNKNCNNKKTAMKTEHHATIKIEGVDAVHETKDSMNSY